MTTASYPFDVQFTISGDSTVYGFMLSTPKGQSKQLVMKEAGIPNVSRIQTNEVFTYQDFDPRFDVPFVMTDFSGGIGELIFKPETKNKYLWSSGVATHVKNKAYAYPARTAISFHADMASDITGTWDFAVVYNDVAGSNAQTLYIVNSAGAIVRMLIGSASAGATDYYDPGAATTDAIFHNGVLYLAWQSTNEYLKLPSFLAANFKTGTAAVSVACPTTLSSANPSYFAKVKSTAYAAIASNVYYTTDMSTDSWQGPINTTLYGKAGDSTYNIKRLLAVGDYLFVIKDDAVYSIDAQQDVKEVIWQFKDSPDSYNFKYTSAYLDNFVYNIGPEVYIYNPLNGSNVNIGIGKNSSFSIKQIHGISADRWSIFVLARVIVPTVRSTDSVALLRLVRKDDGTFHTEVVWEDTTLTNKTYHGCWAFMQRATDGNGAPVQTTNVYTGCDNSSGTSDLYIVTIPSEWDDSVSSWSRVASSLWTSIDRSGFPGFNKKHLYVNFDVNNQGSASNYVTPNYSINEGSSFTAMANVTASELQVTFDNVYSKSIMYRFDFVSSSNTPILKNFDHHQRVRYRYLPSFQLNVRLAKNLELNNRSRYNLDFDVLWGYLTTLRTTDSKITYTDFLGNNFVVSVDEIGIQPIRNQDTNEIELEGVILCTRADRGS